MSLVSYGNDSSDEEQEEEQTTVTLKSSNLLSNLPKPQENSSKPNAVTTSTEFPEDELEDIVRPENKAYAKDLPQVPKPIKRKRDGPVKIFLPTAVENDSDDEEKPKRKFSTVKRNCALLNSLPAPIYDEDKPLNSIPAVLNPSTKTPQMTSTGLFIPRSVIEKKTSKITATPVQQQQPTKNLLGIEDDDDVDDDDGTDFLGLSKSDQVQISSTDVESVLRETFPKARPTHVEQPIVQSEIYPSADDFDDDQNEDDDNIHQSTTMISDDDELMKYLPKSERYKEIKSVHIDSMLGESARLQLLKNVTEERDTIKAQAAIVVPKGEVKKRAQLTYLIAKAKSDDLRLKNMWSEQKLTKRQTQAKYGF